MFATMRRKRRSTNMKSELGQSVDHFRRAATLAAQETSATVGPRFYAARDRVQPAAVKAKGAATSGWDGALAALTPLIAAATENMRTSRETAKAGKTNAKANRKNAKKLEKRANKVIGRKQTGRKTSRLLGFALIGGALGAGAAYAARRRKAAQWDEYDPTVPMNTTQQVSGADEATFKPSEPQASTTQVSTGSAAASDPATSSDIPDPVELTRTGETIDPTVTAGDTTDQTSSAQHSPTVARMASGHNKD